MLSSCNENLNSIGSDEDQNLQHLRVFVNQGISNQTRSNALFDNGELHYYFEEQDEATAYNVNNNYMSYMLSYSVQNSCFEGIYAGSESDEISVVFPKQSYRPADQCIELPLINQNGTIESIANKVYRWGFTSISSKDKGFVADVTLASVMSVLRFNLNHNGSLINNISFIIFKSSKGEFYSKRLLNLRTGSLENGTTTSLLSLSNYKAINNVDGSVYLALFPCAAEITLEIYDVYGNQYIAKVPQTKYVADKVYNYNLDCTQVKEGSAVEDYVEVCGVQWARGNLFFSTNILNSEDSFQKHFYIAPHQSYYPLSKTSIPGTSCTQDSVNIMHFNWGICGDNATSHSAYGMLYGDISEKLYLDAKGNQIADNFNNAQYGDIVWWATKGRYRMPTNEEMKLLYEKADIQYGHYLTYEGVKIYGLLFTTPKTASNRIINRTDRQIYDSELNQGLFLPAIGYRESKSTTLTGVGRYGYYYSSCRGDDAMYQFRFKGPNLYWTNTHPSFGRAIRPVRSTSQNPPQPSQSSKYVEICGVKWAKGNLQFIKGGTTTDGFVDCWSISDNQWVYPNMVSGRPNASSEFNPNVMYLFNWGVCGRNASSISLYSTAVKDISGKMYEDRACIKETADFDKALYGDLAYWASHGQYRMPTSDEMSTLYNKASFTTGFYTTSEGIDVYGYLFYEPNGNRKVCFSAGYFTDKELENGLFLPCAGYRMLKSSKIVRIGSYGYYYNCISETSSSQLFLQVCSYYWRPTTLSIGRSIRPVLNQ